MKFLILALLSSVISFTAHADLTSDFKQLSSTSKGAFGLNAMQGTLSRTNVRDSNPAGTYQFQAAFRNVAAQQLARRYDFWVGNLFTTNYYELMGEYVYGDPTSSHELDHEGLVISGSVAMAKAASMVRHWVLEKHYIHQFKDSGLARGFRIRGISGSEFEQEYAKYFFNFYLSALESDTQFLAGILLARGSPIAESNSLERARSLILLIYDSSNSQFGAADPKVRKLYLLRNQIHNQLTQSVIGQIDQFIRDYPGHQDRPLKDLRAMIVAYYAVGAKTVVDAANKFGSREIAAQAETLRRNGATSAGLKKLSALAADLRTKLSSPSVPWAKKTDGLLVLLATSQYLNKELNGLRTIDSKDVVTTVVNLIYLEGFLIKDNWRYFLGEVESSASVKAAVDQLPDIVGIASDTLTQAFSPAFDQWVSADRRMQYFMDNTIKSSSLNTASILAGKNR